jgi:hypothetical protein
VFDNIILHQIQTLWTAYYEPFYLYCLFGLAIAAGVTWVAWFFPILRSLSGAAVLGIGTFLYGFWKGEQAARTQDEARTRRDS